MENISRQCNERIGGCWNGFLVGGAKQWVVEPIAVWLRNWLVVEQISDWVCGGKKW